MKIGKDGRIPTSHMLRNCFKFISVLNMKDKAIRFLKMSEKKPNSNISEKTSRHLLVF